MRRHRQPLPYSNSGGGGGSADSSSGSGDGGGAKPDPDLVRQLDEVLLDLGFWRQVYGSRQGAGVLRDLLSLPGLGLTTASTDVVRARVGGWVYGWVGARG